MKIHSYLTAWFDQFEDTRGRISKPFTSWRLRSSPQHRPDSFRYYNLSTLLKDLECLSKK